MVVENGFCKAVGLKLSESWISVNPQCCEVVGKSGSHFAEHSEGSPVGELNAIELKHLSDELLNGRGHSKGGKDGKVSRIPSSLAIDEAN